MYLELRTWKGSWFGGESALHIRNFGHSEMPPPAAFGFAAGLWWNEATVAVRPPAPSAPRLVPSPARDSTEATS